MSMVCTVTIKTFIGSIGRLMSTSGKKQAAQEIRSMNDHINALKKKSDDSYTSAEIAAIKNQNDYMRS